MSSTKTANNVAIGLHLDELHIVVWKKQDTLEAHLTRVKQDLNQYSIAVNMYRNITFHQFDECTVMIHFVESLREVQCIMLTVSKPVDSTKATNKTRQSKS